MKTLEIIHLRLAGDSPENLMEIVHACIGSEINQMEYHFYSNVNLANDLAIHLLRNADDKDHKASDVGIRLAALLKEYGMVSHSVWTEHRSLEKNTGQDGTGLQDKEE